MMLLAIFRRGGGLFSSVAIFRGWDGVFFFISGVLLVSPLDLPGLQLWFPHWR